MIALSLFALVLVVSSCEIGKKSRLEKADWLLGRWENKSEHDCFSETWTKNNENKYVAETYMLSRKDTLFREYSELKENCKTLQCIISIPEENNDKPITFTMTKQEDYLLVFENPKHDFPQVISYRNQGDSMFVKISGIQKGKFTEERFSFVKLK